MKKLLTSFLLALMAITSANADTDVSSMTNAIYAKALNATPGQSVTISIQMKNATAATISGFQFSLALPSGATYSSSALSSSRCTTSNFTYAVKGSSTLGVTCYSASSATFSGTSGEVATVTIKAPSTAGDYTLTVSGGVLTSKLGDEYDCSNVSTTLHVHNLTATAAKAATCTTAGNSAYWYCSGCGKYFSNSTATTETTLAKTVIAALGHGQTNGYTATYTWGGTYSAPTCKLTLVCKDCNTTVVNAQSLTTSTSGTYGYYSQTAHTDATCTVAGSTTYTANGKYSVSGSKAYSGTNAKSYSVAALGHSYGTTPTWTWTGTTACTGTLTCTRDNSHTTSANATITSAVKTAATCEVKGTTTYTATATINGKSYSTTKDEQDIAALGHSYSTPVWTWANDGKTASAKITCTHDASHTLSGNATITSVVKTAATCEAKGTTTYTANVTLNGTEYTDSKDVEDIAALGHSYSTIPTWNWTGLTAATASFACSKGDDTQTVTATITNAVTTAATDTKAGVRTYTATVTFEGKTYTDTKTEDIAATGHTYSTTPTWTWDGYTSATAAFTCTNNDDTQTVTATITSAVTTAATCTATGVRTYTAKVTFQDKEYTDTKAETIAATGHSYGEPSWKWAEDGKTASVKFTCSSNDDTQTVNATITSAVKTAATCEVKGTTTYTAKATFNGVEYTDTKDVEDIEALGHSYSTTPTWNWTGLTAATASFACSKGDDTQTVTATITNAVTTAATDTKAGVRTYTATVTFGDKTYTDTKTEEISATGHTYGAAPTWTWDGYSSATAAFTCTNNDDTQTVTATITNVVTTAATCTAAGVRTYTAKVTFQDKEYTDTKTESVAATGHSYGEVDWTWTGYTAAKATKTCANDASHILSAYGTITSAVTTAATCTNTGIRTYTATANLDGSSYINKVTETIAATGHSYGDPSWTWSEDGKTASVKFTCASGDDTKTINATITSAVKTAATCEVKGTTTYTAKATFNGVEYTDTKDVEDIEALGHDYKYADNGDGTHKVTCSRCEYTANEDHNFVDGTCDKCGAEETIADTDISTYDNVIYTNNVEMCAGGNVTLSIKMKNKVSMTGYQFNLYAPSGIDLSTATATRTKTRKEDNVSFSKSVQADGSFKIVCYNTDGETFSGNDGEICTITFQIPNGYAVGNYPIYITTQRITAGGTTYNVNDKIKSTLTVKDYVLGDANSNGEVEVGDLSAIVGFILNTNILASFNEQAADANNNSEVEVGDLSTIVKMILGTSNAKGMYNNNGTFSASLKEKELCLGEETTVYVQMNINDMSGFQFDINLPKGMTCTGISPVTTRINNDYFFGYSNIDDNASRVLCYSPSNTTISGNSGNIVAITIKADDTMLCGDYEYTLSNIINSESERIADVTGILHVSDTNGIRDIIENNPDAVIYDINGKMVSLDVKNLNKLPKGIYIINGKKYNK